MLLHIGAVGKSTRFVYLLMSRSQWRRNNQKRRLLWITEKEAKPNWLPRISDLIHCCIRAYFGSAK